MRGVGGVMVKVDILGVDKDGVNYCVTYDWSGTQKEDVIGGNLRKFRDDYVTIFIANIPKFIVSTLLISLDDDIVFRDVLMDEQAYSISVIGKGADSILNLVDSFINSKTVYIYSEIGV